MPLLNGKRLNAIDVEEGSTVFGALSSKEVAHNAKISHEKKAKQEAGKKERKAKKLKAEAKAKKEIALNLQKIKKQSLATARLNDSKSKLFKKAIKQPMMGNDFSALMGNPLDGFEAGGEIVLNGLLYGEGKNERHSVHDSRSFGRDTLFGDLGTDYSNQVVINSADLDDFNKATKEAIDSFNSYVASKTFQDIKKGDIEFFTRAMKYEDMNKYLTAYRKIDADTKFSVYTVSKLITGAAVRNYRNQIESMGKFLIPYNSETGNFYVVTKASINRAFDVIKAWANHRYYDEYIRRYGKGGLFDMFLGVVFSGPISTLSTIKKLVNGEKVSFGEILGVIAGAATLGGVSLPSISSVTGFSSLSVMPDLPKLTIFPEIAGVPAIGGIPSLSSIANNAINSAISSSVDSVVDDLKNKTLGASPIGRSLLDVTESAAKYDAVVATSSKAEDADTTSKTQEEKDKTFVGAIQSSETGAEVGSDVAKSDNKSEKINSYDSNSKAMGSFLAASAAAGLGASQFSTIKNISSGVFNTGSLLSTDEISVEDVIAQTSAKAINDAKKMVATETDQNKIAEFLGKKLLQALNAGFAATTAKAVAPEIAKLKEEPNTVKNIVTGQTYPAVSTMMFESMMNPATLAARGLSASNIQANLSNNARRLNTRIERVPANLTKEQITANLESVKKSELPIIDSCDNQSKTAQAAIDAAEKALKDAVAAKAESAQILALTKALYKTRAKSLKIIAKATLQKSQSALKIAATAEGRYYSGMFDSAHPMIIQGLFKRLV